MKQIFENGKLIVLPDEDKVKELEGQIELLQNKVIELKNQLELDLRSTQDAVDFILVNMPMV